MGGQLRVALVNGEVFMAHVMAVKLPNTDRPEYTLYVYGEGTRIVPQDLILHTVDTDTIQVSSAA